MSDSEKKQRPNANYKLSRVTYPPDQIVYHYNRERRLEKAPQSVQDLYKPDPPKRFSLLGPLVRTKSMTMMFGLIVAACVLTLAISAMGLLSDTYNLEGNNILVQAIKYEGTVIVAVNKTVKKTGFSNFFRSVPAYTGAVDIAVQPVMKAGDVQDRQPEEMSYHKIFFTFEPEEYYRFSVPFNADELAIVLKTEQKTLGLTVKSK
ncbi:MAG: hypothetical protein FWC24_05640 [Treponema sp.]|nr:hypothetical protein [Treponema sp.]